MKRIIILIVLVLAMVGCGKTQKDVYPSKAVTLISPWPAGGVVDLMARNIATIGSKTSKQPLVVVDKVGGGGVVAFTKYIQEKPDGYNLQLAAITAFSLKPQIIDTLYKLDDYEPIIGMHKVELVLFVNPKKSNLKNFQDVVDRAKSGKLIVGNSGEGDIGRVVEKSIFNSLGSDFKSVVYDGTIGITNALVAGQIELGIAYKGQMTKDYVENGTLLPIATLSAEPIKEYAGVKNIPSLGSLGFDFLKNGIDSQYFISARKGTPQEVKDAIFKQISEIYKTKEFKDLQQNLGYEMSPMTSEELKTRINNESKDVKTMIDIISNYKAK